jgi:hypothetical protein
MTMPKKIFIIFSIWPDKAIIRRIDHPEDPQTASLQGENDDWTANLPLDNNPLDTGDGLWRPESPECQL